MMELSGIQNVLSYRGTSMINNNLIQKMKLLNAARPATGKHSEPWWKNIRIFLYGTA